MPRTLSLAIEGIFVFSFIDYSVLDVNTKLVAVSVTGWPYREDSPQIASHRFGCGWSGQANNVCLAADHPGLA
jgi:hypothetical protein